MGTKALYPNRTGGRPVTFTKPIRQRLVDLALSSPRDHQMPLRKWSLERLTTAAIREGIVETISQERLREILHEEAVSYQAIKTWKTSNDPKFRQKVRRIRELCDRPHNPPVVVSADEMGPIQLKPHGGRTWARVGHPDRIRATYKRTFGTRYLFGMHDYYHDRMDGFLFPTKHAWVWRKFLRFVRGHYPSGERVYLINDNLSTDWTPECLALANELNIEMVPTPTNASHINPIEAHFGEVKDLALTGSDYPSWRSLSYAVHEAIFERNTHAVPKHKVKRCLWVRH